MSTKIYTGFILAPGTDIFDLSKKAKDYFLPVLQKRLHEEYISSLVYQYDQAYFSETAGSFKKSHGLDENHVITVHDVRKVANKALDDYVKDTYNFQIRIGFGLDKETGRMLGYFNGPEEFFEEFLTFDGVAEYHYQNSSDGPDDISEEDWDARRKAWDRVLPIGSFTTEMLVSTIANPWDIDPRSVSIAKAQKLGVKFPSVESRLDDAASQVAFVETLKDKTGDANDTFSVFLSVIHDKELIAKWSGIMEARINKDLDYGFFEDITNIIQETA